ncbi:MAG: hypothetical protein COB53_07355 [Elusimicrobia bacterium]|nr:MAG: hypothetical protein COB53_07355 [Elusimicrobiota bacterium]
MNGSLVNAAAIVCGGTAGLVLGRRFAARFKEIAIQALALVVILIGLQMALKAEQILATAAGMVLGGLFGEWLNLERGLERLGQRLKKKVRAGDDSKFTEGFVSTTLLFCVGSMAILGSIEEGVLGNPNILYTKAFLDGIFSIAAAATFGVGVLFSAIPVLLYQGTITLGAARLAPMLTPEVIGAISSTGGMLIAAIGTNQLGVTKIRLANLLPGIFTAAAITAIFS